MDIQVKVTYIDGTSLELGMKCSLEEATRILSCSSVEKVELVEEPITVKALAIAIITTHRAGQEHEGIMEYDAVKLSLDSLSNNELEQLMNELTANHFSGYEECQAFRDTYNF